MKVTKLSLWKDLQLKLQDLHVDIVDLCTPGKWRKIIGAMLFLLLSIFFRLCWPQLKQQNKMSDE